MAGLGKVRSPGPKPRRASCSHSSDSSVKGCGLQLERIVSSVLCFLLQCCGFKCTALGLSACKEHARVARPLRLHFVPFEGG